MSKKTLAIVTGYLAHHVRCKNRILGYRGEIADFPARSPSLNVLVTFVKYACKSQKRATLLINLFPYNNSVSDVSAGFNKIWCNFGRFFIFFKIQKFRGSYEDKKYEQNNLGERMSHNLQNFTCKI